MLYKICSKNNDLYVLAFGAKSFIFTKKKDAAVSYGYSLANGIREYLNRKKEQNKTWKLERC